MFKTRILSILALMIGLLSLMSTTANAATVYKSGQVKIANVYVGDIIFKDCQLYKNNSKALEIYDTDGTTLLQSYGASGYISNVQPGYHTVVIQRGTTVKIRKLAPEPQVTNVSLDVSTLTLIAGGETAKLIATVTANDDALKGITWSSSETSVATVNNGVVTPVAAGTTVITATSTWDNTKTATCTVTVTTVNVTSVSLSQTEATLNIGETLTLTPTVLPDNAMDKTVTWASSDETVATVADGVVTAVAAGTATITVTTTDGAKTATCTITVSPAGYSVALKSGTDDADKWQGKAGEGEYQALPLTGLEAGTAVSVKYNGTKKVKSVKAASTGVQDPIDLTSTDGGVTWTLTSSPAYDVELEVTYYTDAELAAKEAMQTAIAIASNINPEGLADAITAAQAALNDENATAESMAQAAQTLEAAIKTYFGEVLPNLGAIVTALNEETLNTAYANAQTALADEDVTPQELAAAMQQVITAAQAVAPEHLQNLKGYAVKYGAEEAASLIDNALAAIEAGNVSQIIAMMTAVKNAATPLAQQVLSTMIGYVQAFGLTDQAAQAQAALDGGNYITMITTAKALFTHLIAAAREYLPKLGDIAEGLNDETLNTAYAAAQALLAKESITPEELATAMQNIITAAQAVAPEHLQNLKGYAVKYGATDAATLVDNALAAIEAGNVAQIIATMTAVKEAATPLAQTVLGTMKNYVEAFGLTEQAAQAQAALDGGNYITMITTAKALFTHLIAAANEYLPKLGDIAEGLNDETLNTAYAAAQALLAQESITPEELATAMQNIITAAQAVAPEHLQNLKGYAVKYGAEDAVAKVDAALAAIEAGNVTQIIATMTAVKEAATPLAISILTQMIEDAKNYEELAEDVTAAQAALEGGNYITMIITAKALYAKLIAVAEEAEKYAVLTYKLGEQSTTSMTVKKGNMDINITAEEGWAVETLTVNGADKMDDFVEGKLTLSIDADTEVSVTFGWADTENLYTEDIATGIATIEGENIKVYAKDGQLCVDGVAGKSVRLYTVGGQLITSVIPSEGKTAKFSVPAGTYIVQVGSKAAKVVIK